MKVTMTKRPAAEVAGYFDLQLRFADRLAAAANRPLAEMLGEVTNLHRRFGLGRLDPAAPGPDWRRFVTGVTDRPVAEDRLAWTVAAYEAAPPEPLPPDQTAFGAFACELADAEGQIRIHFHNVVDEDGPEGPLARSRAPMRRAELTAMFTHIAVTQPQARRLAGASWLYNLEAYRRLFPAVYAESRTPCPEPHRLNGSSTWGQAIDHRNRVRPEVRERLLHGPLDPAAPWRAFPLPALMTHAPLSAFYDFYGVGAVSR